LPTEGATFLIKYHFCVLRRFVVRGVAPDISHDWLILAWQHRYQAVNDR